MIKIGLVDDHAVTRKRLRALLEGDDGLKVAEGKSGNDALEFARTSNSTC